MKIIRSVTASAILGVLAFALMSQAAKADTLHGFCAASDGCTSAATIQDPTNPPTFGFTYAGTPGPGDVLLDFLVPEADGDATGPIAVSGSVSGTAMLFSTTPWTTKDLDTYLGISASPTNPIGNYGPGFYVYQLDLGTLTLCQNGGGTCTFSLMSSSLPVDTYILAFQNEGSASAPDWVATANSESILVTGTPIPEPSSLMLLGTGALGLAGVIRRRFGR